MFWDGQEGLLCKILIKKYGMPIRYTFHFYIRLSWIHQCLLETLFSLGGGKVFRKADVHVNANFGIFQRWLWFRLWPPVSLNYRPSWFFIGLDNKPLKYLTVVQKRFDFIILFSDWSKRSFKISSITMIVERSNLRQRYWKSKS